LSPEEIMRIADSTALFACDSVIQTSTQTKGPAEREAIIGISFDNIADWYTTAGYRIAPWLELLDLSKWNQLITN
jgi:hypothetical protein